jgi:hypothetical protein
VLVALGLWIRLKVSETPAFKAALEQAPPPAVPVGTLLRHHWPAVIAGSAGVIACFAIFYLSTAFALGHMTTARGVPRETALALQLGANCFMAVGILWSAVWSDRKSPRRVLIYGSAGTVVLGVLFGPALAAGSLLTVFLTLSFAMVVMGLAYGPLGAWLPTLFPVTVRYTGVSVAFNCGGIIGGAVAPVAAQWLSGMGGISLVGLFLSVAGLVTLMGVVLGKLSEPADAL